MFIYFSHFLQDRWCTIKKKRARGLGQGPNGMATNRPTPRVVTTPTTVSTIWLETIRLF